MIEPEWKVVNDEINAGTNHGKLDGETGMLLLKLRERESLIIYLTSVVFCLRNRLA